MSGDTVPLVQTLAPDQLGEIDIPGADALAMVWSPGGPLQKIAFRRLLAKLIATEFCVADEPTLAGDLAHDEDTVALVFNDPDPTKNGWWRKTGAADAGEWVQFEELSSAVRAAAAASADEAAASATLAASYAAALSDLRLLASNTWLFGVRDRVNRIAGGWLRSGAFKVATAIIAALQVGSIVTRDSKKVLSLAGLTLRTGGKAWAWAPFIDKAGRVPGYIDTAGVWNIETAVIANLTVGANGSGVPIVLAGDSLTYGYGASISPAQRLAAATGRPVYNLGIPGQAAAQIAGRLDAVRHTIRLAGAELVDGAVTITHFDGQTIAHWFGLSTGRKSGALPFSTPGNFNTYKSLAWLGTLLGMVTRTADADGEYYTFEADPDYASALPKAIADDTVLVIVPSVPSTGEPVPEDAVLIPWLGRNDVPETGSLAGAFTAAMAGVAAATAAIVARWRNGKVFPVGITGTSAEPAGNDCHNAIQTHNASQAALYTDRFIDMHREKVETGLARGGIDNSSDNWAQDQTDIGNDVIPLDLRSDGTHDNDNGTLVTAAIINSHLLSKGI